MKKSLNKCLLTVFIAVILYLRIVIFNSFSDCIQVNTVTGKEEIIKVPNSAMAILWIEDHKLMAKYYRASFVFPIRDSVSSFVRRDCPEK